MLTLDNRWKNFNEDYYERDNLVKNILENKKISSVLDLGSGHQNLESFFFRNNISYIPVDKYKRSNNTIICDFDKFEFPSNKTDCSLALGILEYVSDINWFIDKLSDSTNMFIIFSYHGLEDLSDLKIRSKYLWKNNYKNIDLLSKFNKFKMIDVKQNCSERIYLLERRSRQ
jgi:hypothetical protein